MILASLGGHSVHLNPNYTMAGGTLPPATDMVIVLPKGRTGTARARDGQTALGSGAEELGVFGLDERTRINHGVSPL
jgi:hypothetical protein